MELIINSKSHGMYVVFFDEEDYELVSSFKWTIKKGRRDVYYARAVVKKSLQAKFGSNSITMHNLVMGLYGDNKNDKNITVDHININGLDNRKGNLRLATRNQQTANTRLCKDSSTGFKGVSFIKKKRLYIARVRVNGKLISGGRHKNIYKAAMKYNELAIKYFGEFARLNQLTEPQIANAMAPPSLDILKNNVTGYRGVSLLKNGKYAATIYANNKNIGLGTFDTPKDAAMAYNRAVVKYKKDLRRLNVI